MADCVESSSKIPKLSEDAVSDSAVSLQTQVNWRKSFPGKRREYYIQKIVRQFVPINDMSTSDDSRAIKPIAFARKAEDAIYNAAKSRVEYYKLIDKKINKIKEECKGKKVDKGHHNGKYQKEEDLQAQQLQSSKKSNKIHQNDGFKQEQTNTEVSLLVHQCLDCLVRASYCTDLACKLSNCLQMKRVIKHAEKCRRRKENSCSTCKEFTTLCSEHSKDCKVAECPVLFCVNTKHKPVKEIVDIDAEEWQRRMDTEFWQRQHRQISDYRMRVLARYVALMGNFRTETEERRMRYRG